jgi:hypothetical protein
MNWGQRRTVLAKERRWAASYVVGHAPELQAADLIKGGRYAVLTRHSEDCRLLAGGRCSCRPDIRFFAEPARQ